MTDAVAVTVPGPVTVAVQGVRAEPLKVTELGEQVIAVFDVALLIVKVTFVAVAVVWLASLHEDDAVAVPALVLPA